MFAAVRRMLTVTAASALVGGLTAQASQAGEINWTASPTVGSNATRTEPNPIVIVQTATELPALKEIEFPAAPSLDEGRQTLPINLPAALKLAEVQPIDIQVAAQRIQAAAAQLSHANVQWLPTIFLGTDYARQDGQIQDVAGNVFGTSKSSFMVGGAPYAVFALTDAIFAPLSERQLANARQSDKQTAQNDTMLAVAEAYFGVQQARGDLAGARAAVGRSRELVARTVKLSRELVNPLEVNRAKTELARQEQAVETALERWQLASSDLTRLLRLDPTAVTTPVEPPHLKIDLIDLTSPVDDLIPIALQNRPELTSNQALVQATLTRLKQERLRPLIPSVLLRGNATNPAGTLSSGLFGGGLNGNVSNFSGRNSMDLQVLWEFQNLGLGNRATVRERQTESQTALLEMFRTQDRIAAEVAQALEQSRRAAKRIGLAEEGLYNAVESAQKNLEALSQTRRSGELLVLIVRPLEVVAAISALEQAYRDYYGAVADFNRAQFRLYRALGRPAQCVIKDDLLPITLEQRLEPAPAAPAK